MSKIHSKTGSVCMICDEKPNKSILFHKTLRQTHLLCLECGIEYLKPIIKIATDNLRKNIREDVCTIKCPGSIHGHLKNMCKYTTNIKNLKVPDCGISLDLFRLTYVLENNDSYICPNSKCGNVVNTVINNITCNECQTSWCIYCRISPFHTGKSCIEVDIENNKSENGKMILDLKNKGKLKFCPCCSAPCIKNNGCNKMICASCHNKWCWLCLTVGINYDHYKSSECTGQLWKGVDKNGNDI